MSGKNVNRSLPTNVGNEYNLRRILTNNVSILTGDINQGKSMILVNMIEGVMKHFPKANVFCFSPHDKLFARMPSKVQRINTLLELERARDGFVFIDEVANLIRTRKPDDKDEASKLLQMLAHKNLKLVLCGPPTNFDKFLSGKATCFIYLSLTLKDLVNGSLIKSTLLQYDGAEMGTRYLDLPKGHAIAFDNYGMWRINSVLLSKYDTKQDNINLFEKEN